MSRRRQRIRFTLSRNFESLAGDRIRRDAMRSWALFAVLAILAVIPATSQQASSSAPTYTLTVVVEGVNNLGGNVGMLVFNSPKGWAEDRTAALKDISLPAHEGTNTIEVPALPAGEYAVALVHD